MSKLEHWKQNLQEFNESELSLKKWCESKNIKMPTFQYWRKKLATIDSNESVDDVIFAEIPVSKFQMNESSTSVTLRIIYNRCEVVVTSLDEVELAAAFFSQLQKLC
ncbi:MAG: hypothetical protein R3Y24_13745 [Eubacteriales bacterium]